jgi:hypothetical protein
MMMSGTEREVSTVAAAAAAAVCLAVSVSVSVSAVSVRQLAWEWAPKATAAYTKSPLPRAPFFVVVVG